MPLKMSVSECTLFIAPVYDLDSQCRGYLAGIFRHSLCFTAKQNYPVRPHLSICKATERQKMPCPEAIIFANSGMVVCLRIAYVSINDQ